MEARELVKCTKTIYDHHFEKIEVSTAHDRRHSEVQFPFQQEEFENQRKLHASIEQVVADLAEARRDYELLQVEYEKVLIANQQSGSHLLATGVPLFVLSRSRVRLFQFLSHAKCEV